MKLQDILIWILFILTIIIVMWYILGNSPALEQAILILILTLSITTVIKIKVLETRFSYLVRDFKEHLKQTR